MSSTPVVFSDQDIDQSGQSSKPITFGEDDIAKPSSGTALGDNPLGPGSAGYKSPAAARPQPRFTDVWYPRVSTEAQAGAARATSPRATASKAAGMPVADVAGKPQEPQGEERIQGQTGTVYHESAVPEADAVPVLDSWKGVEPIATGLSRYKENDKPVFSVDPNNRFGPPVRTVSEADAEKQRRQRVLGASEVLQGSGDLMTPIAVGTGLANPLPVIAGYGAGYGASEGIGAGVHGHVSPEDEQLIRAASYFIPSALGVATGLKTGTVETPQGKFSAASIFGGKAGAGVRTTPEGTFARVKVGGTTIEVPISRNGGAPATAEAPAPAAPLPAGVTSMVKANAAETMARNVVAGRPPVPPPPAPPPTPGEQFGNKLSGAQVDHLAKTIADQPEAKRNGLIEEAHQNLTQWVADNKGKVIIDGKVHIAKTPDQAETLAAKLVNDAVTAHDKATAEAAKVQVKPESSQQPAKSSPEAPSKSAAEVQRFLASSRPPKAAAPVQELQAPTPKPDQASLGNEAAVVPPEPQTTQKLTANEGAKQEVAPPKVFSEKDIQPAHEYASTQVNIEPKSELGKRHAEAVAAIPDEHIGPNGKEETPHVTVRYGLKDDSPEAIAHIKDAAAKIAPFEATVGKTGSFPATKEGDRPIIAQVEKSPELDALRSAVEGAGEFKADDHGEYKPHVTLGYVKPEHVAKHEGGNHLEGGKVPVDHIVVSKRDGTTERIPLEGGYKYEPLAHDVMPEGKTFYHGTPHGLTELKDADPVGFSGELNIYGPGLYLTDNPKVAEGYKRTKKADEGRAEQRHVLSAELPGAKVLDLEKPLPEKVLQLFNRRIEQYTPLGMSAFPEGTKGTHIYSELRDESAAQRIPAYEIQDLLGDISQNLVEMGYHGLRHEGGRSAGKKYGPHNVVVLFPDYDSGKGTVYGNRPERRTNTTERKRVADMKPEEMARELHTSRLDNGDGTHTEMPIPNGRAFHDAPASPAVAMSDSDGLKAFNDKFGYKAGNAILVAKGEVAKEAGLDAYHQKGDEFLYHGESPEQLKAGLEKAREILRNREFTVTDATGKQVTLKGVDFSYGTGTDLATAESGLKAHKQQREASGERARGELRGITEVGHETAAEGGSQEVAPQTFHESEIEHELPEGVPAKGKSGEVPTGLLHFDPKRFQYKLNVNEKGVTNLLHGQKFNQDLAGVVSVWHDPEDGKLYVVNGHHRAQLAKETGQKELLVRHLDVATAGEARAVGALQNIAEGRGTAIDAAKFFRDRGISPEDLSKHGISLGEAKAADGLALSRLDQSIFERVATGKMSEGRGVAIGQATTDPAQQEAIVKLLDKREKQGKNITDAMVAELARFVGSSGNKTIEQGGLFGANQQIHSLALEKAEISAHIKGQIAKERRVFGSVATEDKAAALGQVKGQKLKAEQNKRIADAAGQAEEAYNKLSSHAGPVNDILEKSAKELASGYHKPEDVKARAYRGVRDELRKAVTGSEGQSVGRVQEHPEHAKEDAGNADRQASVETAPIESPAPKPEEATSKTKEVTEPAHLATGYTLADHAAFSKKLGSGEITADQVRANYEKVKANESAIKAELAQKTVPELKKLVNSFYRNDLKKAQLVDSVYDGMLLNHAAGKAVSYSMGFNDLKKSAELKMAAYDKAVAALTDKDIADYANDRKQRTEKIMRTMTNPETLDEFNQFVRYRGKDKLSPEQKIKYDELIVEHNKERASDQLESRARVSGVQLGETKLSYKEGKHTKTGETLHIVQLSDRVAPEKYRELLGKAKQLGGHYSSFIKADAGFQFKSKEAADKFMEVGEGKEVSRLEDLQARKEEVKDNAVDRLRSMADSMEEKANDSLARDRKDNTARRAQMASNAEAQAQTEIAVAKTMRNLAEAIEEGKAKHLEGIRARTHVEALDTALYRAKLDSGRAANERYEVTSQRPATVQDIEHTIYPYPVMPREDLLRLAKELENKPGAILAAARVRKMQEDKARGIVIFRTEKEIDDLRTLGEKAVGLQRYMSDRAKEEVRDYDRMQSMGIPDLPTLRAALREYLQYKGNKAKTDNITTMKRELVGRDFPGFFPTPEEPVNEMLRRADIQPGMKVLEPSAGWGNIADAIRSEHPESDVETIEWQPALRKILEASGHNVVGNDFMEHKGEYDRIVMNPPFEDGKDIEHVQHAYEMLKPGGRLVAIMSEGTFSNSAKKFQTFRDWLDEHGGDNEKLEAGSFKSSERPTGVNTRMVWIDKPADRQASHSQPSHLEAMRRRSGGEEAVLPGMQPHLAAEKESIAAKQGEDLTREIAAPKESISAKAGEMERNSPLFRDTEASGQSGLFNRPVTPAKGDTVTLADGREGTVQYVHPEMNIARVKTGDGKTVTVGLKSLKDRSGEAGFAKLDIPSAVADLVKAAHEKVFAPTENRIARGVDDTLYQLGKQYDADVLRTIKLLKSVGPTTSPEDQEAIYHHKEDSTVRLNQRQQGTLDNVVQPLMDTNSEMRAKLNNAGIPMGEDDGYIHRVVQGKNNPLERAMRGKGGTGKGNVLSKAASSLKGRRMFAAEDEDGKRVVIHRNGDTMTAFDNGSASEFAKDKPGLQVGDEFNSKDGQRWTLKQATTKEIEEHTGVRYYKNALANTVVDYLQLRRAERANDALEGMKADPEFKSLSFKPEHGEMPPDGWRTVNLPQFNGYYFEPHMAETLDRFADELRADPAGAMEKIGNLMTASLVLNPARHVYNIGNHWLVERGVTGNFNPLIWPRSAKAGIRAIKAVMTQNDDFVNALDHGAPMMSHRQDLRELHQHLVDSMLGFLQQHTDVAAKIAELGGHLNHVDMLKGLYKLGQKMTWMSNDMFFLQSIYEKELGGMKFDDAAAETAKHIPDYRIPSRVLNSPGLSKFMNSHLLTVFSRYHYGVWKSYGQMLKEVAGPESSLKDRAKGLDHMLMLGLLTFVGYELWDKLLKHVTGDPKARMVRSGASAVPYLVNEIAQGNKPPEELIQGTFTPAVLPKTAAELAFNRDLYSGGRIYDRHDPAATIAHDVGKKTMGALGPSQQAEKAERSDTPMRDFLAYQGGVTFPNTEVQSPAVRLMHEILRENMTLTPELQKQLDDKRARIQSGNLTQKERKTQLKKEALDELSYYLPHVARYSDVKKIFNAATPEEKEIIRPIMLKKAVNVMRNNPIEGEREGALQAFEER